jgi:uncharacterized protein YbjT (DUF2867 family)
VDSGIDWTILRPSEFMTNTLWWLTEIEARGTISVPSGQGRVSFIDPADIAAVAFAALTSPGHAGKVYHVTGPEALSTADVATQFGRLVGRRLTHVDISDGDFRAGARQANMPEPLIQLLSEYYGVLKEGRMEVLTRDVEQVTGRHPTAFVDWALATLPVMMAATA